MSTTTSHLGLVKPDQGEQYNVDIVNANNDTIDAAVFALQGATTPGSIVDLSGSVTALAGFAMGDVVRGIKMGNLAQLDIKVNRTGVTLAAGNIGNVGMFTLPAGWRPIMATGMTTTGFGGMASAAINPGGQVDLAALGNDWPQNIIISWSALFLIP